MRANRKLLMPATVIAGIAGVAGIAAVALSGCAPTTPSATPAPTVTVTATATVTAAPAAPVEPSPDDPLTALTAWSVCYARAVSDGNLPADEWDPPTYQPDSVTPEGDGFSMIVGFAPKGGGYGAGYDCTVTGTVGAPVITNFNGPYDFG